MSEIKVLDCTLRDGGYINGWDFGKKSIEKIFQNLNKAKIDYIEIGFLKDGSNDIEKSLFDKVSDIEKYLPCENIYSKITAMIIFGQYDISKLPPKKDCRVDAIRVTFKKNQLEEVFPTLEKIKNLGYELFVNPTNAEMYDENDMLNLIQKVNKLMPFGFSIVDTNGVLKEKDLERLYSVIDKNLDKKIILCFHSHNSLQLSFSNAQYLLKINKNRNLVIDSTVFGMGRGAGNLCSELLVQYLNDNYSADYEIVPILKIIDEYINPIFARTPWGYSVPYYLAAVNHCHPNYAKYMVDRQTVPVEIINKLLRKIPNEKKSIYDSELIRQIYLDNFSNVVNDENVVKKLAELILNKNILILAPGKSLIGEKEKINNYISIKNPFVISLNFIPDDYKEDIVFVTNAKRFLALEDYSKTIYATSNIENLPDSIYKLNYSSYLNHSKAFDNTVLMMLSLLIKIGVKEVSIAGLDGFSSIPSENYATNEYVNIADAKKFQEKNIAIQNQLNIFSKNIGLNFITKSLYEEKIN